ncbi:hypothetical protein F8M41_011902 [Gigaspora margarita]|uniref:Uncharacterized protein n=1 Tax=Gigaspora margarita TaxID=4874 RepID=A0A8H4ATP8_GIGMA|nr:hypothetical protein F8M41_011902 [Gigaspora margarita]
MARMLREEYYFWRIPEAWIDIREECQKVKVEDEEETKPELTELLEEVKKHLEELEVYRKLAELPITNQNKIKNTIAQLHKFFIFKKALDFVFDLLPLLKMTWNDIPEKLLLY